jgi:hypothetical protein
MQRSPKDLDLEANLSLDDQQFLERAIKNASLTKSLNAGLNHAIRLYAKDQKAAWCVALDTVVEFLKLLGVERRLFAPLDMLSCAVDDLQYGIVDEGLKPEPFEGGPRVPTNKFLHQVMATVAVTLLHEEAKLTLDEAVCEASKLSGITKGTLVQFRKNTLAGRRSWKANGFYWIELRHLRARFTLPEGRVAYIREWFADRGQSPNLTGA